MSIKSKAMPTQNFLNKQAKEAIQKEIARVCVEASRDFVFESIGVPRIVFIKSTPFSKWWNLTVKYDYPFDRKAFVAFVSAMCHIYKLQRMKNYNAKQTDLFQNAA